MTDLGMPTVASDPYGNLRGSEPFPVAARRSLADTQLRQNLGHATRTIRAKRAGVVAEVDDWEELRRAGEGIKADVMARLPELLVQFEEAVTARGGVVHWARDAVEANRIVVDLVRETGADEVVKVKSMATQETGLNEALGEAGIAALETDLAELIVQLSDDRPSHFLVPAIHRNRSEIRDIFLREMPDVDPELTDEPRLLAMAARAHLRRKFLSARVGISGVNFAVADTGTISVVESEGNGRMCLTLPDTLITVMGVEKIVPHVVGPRGVPAAAAAVVDRGADEPVHVDVERGDARRRAADLPPRAARQRPLERPRLARRPPGAALHPLLGVPQRLPGLRARGRPRLRLGLPGADRCRADPAAHRASRGPTT